MGKAYDRLANRIEPTMMGILDFSSSVKTRALCLNFFKHIQIVLF